MSAASRVADPNPMGTGPTKWRHDHCTTHHHACDCREWAHAVAIEQLSIERDALQSRLDAVVAAVAKHRDTFPDEALPSELELWESIAALGCATTGEMK